MPEHDPYDHSKGDQLAAIGLTEIEHKQMHEDIRKLFTHFTLEKRTESWIFEQVENKYKGDIRMAMYVMMNWGQLIRGVHSLEDDAESVSERMKSLIDLFELEPEAIQVNPSTTSFGFYH